MFQFEFGQFSKSNSIIGFVELPLSLEPNLQTYGKKFKEVTVLGVLEDC